MSQFWYAAYSPVFVDMARNAFEKMGKDVHVEVYTPARLEAMEAAGVRIILARGMTAQRIRAFTDIPVVEIPVTFEDLMSALLAASSLGSRIAIIGYHNVMQGIERLNPIMNVNIRQITALDAEDTYQHLIRLREEQVDVVVGGIYQTDLARRLGLPTVRIDLSERALAFAVHEAEQLLSSLLCAQRKKEELNLILNTTREGYLTIDQNGCISLINQTALRYFTGCQLDLIGLRLLDVCPALSKALSVLEGKGDVTAEPVSLPGRDVLCDITPLKNGPSQIIGAMLTFHDTDSITRGESRIRSLGLRRHAASWYFHGIVGDSAAVRDAVSLAKRYAESDLTVLITGETGSGREMFAQSIHNAGRRKKFPFIAVNCASLPGTLLEAELFGTQRSSGSGGFSMGRVGLYEQAHNGTLFLDEIESLPPLLQNRLLRTIQEKSVLRAGGFSLMPVDVRIIAASSQDLFPLVEQGQFRADLFYRLNVLALRCPPLRERREDIPLLIRTFLREDPALRGTGLKLTEEAVSLLAAYPWPGNARQLKNFLRRMSIISAEKEAGAVFTAGLLARFEPGGEAFLGREPAEKQRENDSHAAITREQLLLALSRSQNSPGKAAALLGVHRTTVWRLCRKYGISVK